MKLKNSVLFAGKLDDSGELTEKEIIRAERNSGVISNRVREIQVNNLGFELCFISTSSE